MTDERELTDAERARLKCEAEADNREGDALVRFFQSVFRVPHPARRRGPRGPKPQPDATTATEAQDEPEPQP